MKQIKMNELKLPTVTIGIPAYNEDKNIGSLLAALKNQKISKVNLEKVMVYTDGSKDQTPQIVDAKAKDWNKIQHLKGEAQKGKFARLNEMYQINNSDVLILLDADVGIADDWFIEKFALNIINDDKAMLVAAHELPILPKDFIGRVIASTYTMWDQVRWSVPNYDNVHNLYQRGVAYRGSFAKTLYIPDGATEERLYLYLSAKKHNGFRYALNSVLRYLPASTLEDYKKLSRGGTFWHSSANETSRAFSGCKYC